jgi:hypothetical protein
MQNVSLPLLAIPFMGGAALRLGVPVAAEWQGARLATAGKQLCVQPTPAALITRQADRLVFCAPAEMTGRREPVLRAEVSDQSWDRLGLFAQRTFAPASEDSRLRGAGAGLSDND